jgi:hypothetical protein
LLQTALSAFPLGSAMKLGKAGLELKALSGAENFFDSYNKQLKRSK